ncbi:MAG: bifunctional riboflavin kinase/FAD synthetase [Alphaproteobacteria bacterium]|nr:bifunctional riboflavin kinase/FAD synthetase [Alphaproteobacteria bacterium]
MVKGVVAAIGNFDGVHLGHQRLLAETAALAAEKGAPAGAVVFEPHPRRFFRPDDPPFLLTTPESRDALLKAHGAAHVTPLRFDAALAAMTPEQFVDVVLKGRLGLAGVVTGTEFRFGKGRAGDAATLKALGEAAGLVVRAVTPKIEIAGDGKISSSAIRAALREGDAQAAAAMLGRPWSVEGEVLPGQRIGRGLGFPTANLRLGELIEPRRGVYVAQARVGGRAFGAVAYFGRRPTIGEGAPLLEVHLFDFDADLYGQRLEARLLDFVREDRKFDDVAALRAQIAADCAAARRRLAALQG